MKITKNQLRRIIKEEKARLQEVEALAVDSEAYMVAYEDLFDELRNAFANAKQKGLIIDDIDEAISDAKEYINGSEGI